MQKLLLVFILSLFSTWALAQNSNKALKFPDDFYLKAEETPKGFQLAVIDEAAKADGFSTNPALVNVQKFAGTLYPRADPSTMKRMLITVFSDKDPEGMDIDVATIEYNSAEDMKSELAKFYGSRGLRVFLTRDKYLTVVSGDLSGSYRKAVDQLATGLAARLGLKREQFNIDEVEPEPEEEAVAVPAE